MVEQITVIETIIIVKMKNGIKYDLKTCCSRNEICSDMTCPLGYYNKKQNDNKSCFNEICD